MNDGLGPDDGDPPADRAGGPRFTLSIGDPPPEVRAAIEAATARAARLASEDRELHFAVDEETGRVVVEVRDLAGRVNRVITGSEALDVLGGGELP